ncbi:MAG: ATP-binding protein [Comamonadaceae bacterium]|nr:ATP-binding protein [Comamonadaceae bacterium]
MIALAITLLYLLIQILLMQQTHIQRTGERVLWDITQAERETLRMQHSLQQWQSGALDNDTMALRYDLWQSRIQLLRDGPQWRNLHAMGLAPVLHDVFSQALNGPARAASAHASPMPMVMPSPALLNNLSEKLRAASSQISTTERVEYDQALARQHQLIRAALLALLLLIVCIGALLLMLLRQLQQRERHTSLLKEQRRLLQSDIAALQAAHRAHALYRYFVALLSQQMRAPLLEINTHMQRLKHGIQRHPSNLPGQGNDLAPLLERKSRHIREATLRVHNLITSVLSRLHVENGQLRANRLPCSLYVLAQQCCGRIRTLYPGRILHLRIQDADQDGADGNPDPAAQSRPLTLRTYRSTFDVRQARLANLPAFALLADPALLEQLILNVLENACRYTPLDRPIEMSLSSTRNALELRVRDWGQGLSEAQIATLLPDGPDDIEAILTNEKGLGLQAAQAIAQLHGGTLSVTSAQPQGLCVTLLLPR